MLVWILGALPLLMLAVAFDVDVFFSLLLLLLPGKAVYRRIVCSRLLAVSVLVVADDAALEYVLW